MKIDIDKMTRRAVQFLIALQKPFEIRAGFHGVNVRSACPGCSQRQECYDCWMIVLHDDKNRLKINRTQKLHNLPHNVLWDIKRGQKKPDTWHWIETEQDIDRFLRQFTGYY